MVAARKLAAGVSTNAHALPSRGCFPCSPARHRGPMQRPVRPRHRRPGRALYVRGLLELPAGRPLAVDAGQRLPPSSVVPLALHVDYWDYIGWKDPYAKREFSLRQRKFTQLQRMAFVYTPQVMLQGRDFRGWGSKAFDAGGGAASTPSRRGPTSSSRSSARTRTACEVEAARRARPGVRRRRPLPRGLPEPARKPGERRRKPRPAAHPRLRRPAVARAVRLAPASGLVERREAALAARRGPRPFRGGGVRAGPAHRGGAAGPSPVLPAKAAIFL